MLEYHTTAPKLAIDVHLEAQYAEVRKKKIIPILVQKGYSPDGWLGLCFGMTLRANFSNVPDRDLELSVLEGGSELETRYNSLKKLIGEYGKAGPGDAPPVPKSKV